MVLRGLSNPREHFIDIHTDTTREVVSRNIKMKGCKDVRGGGNSVFSSFRMGKEKREENKESKHWVSAQGKKHTQGDHLLFFGTILPNLHHSPFPWNPKS